MSHRTLEKAILPLFILLDFSRFNKLGRKAFTLCEKAFCFLERITRSPHLCALSLFYQLYATGAENRQKRSWAKKRDHFGQQVKKI